jgi:hypothetical protein
MSGISTMRKGNPMNRKLASAIAMSTATVFAAAAATLVTLASAHADDITVEQAPLVSTLTRDEVNAEFKKPYVDGQSLVRELRHAPEEQHRFAGAGDERVHGIT